MYMKVDRGREGWVELLGREGRPGVTGQESIGRLKSPQRMKGSEGNKTVRASDNLSKKSSYREGGLRQGKYTHDMIKGHTFGGRTRMVTES